MKKIRPVLAGLAVIALMVGAGWAVAAPEKQTVGFSQRFMPMGAMVANFGNNNGQPGTIGGRWGCFFTCGNVPCLVGGKFTGFGGIPGAGHPQKSSKFACNDMQAVPGFGLEGLLIKPWGGCGSNQGGNVTGYIRINNNGKANAVCQG